MLPGEAEEVEAGNARDAAAMLDATVGVEDGQLDPRVVGAVAGRPDDAVGLDLAAVGEAQRPPRDADETRLQGDAVTAHVARARSDQRVAVLQATADPRLDRLVEHAHLRQPPEEVAAEQPLRQRRLSRPDRQVDGMRPRQLLRDLVAGVASADDHDRSRGNLARPAVPGAVRLEDLRRQVTREARDVRHLERPGRDDDLIRLDRAAVQLDDEAVTLARQRARPRVRPHGKLELRGVLLEVGHDLVTGRIAIRIARESDAPAVRRSGAA